MAVKDQEIGNSFAVWNGDCIDVMKSLPDGKIHLSLYSPPFATNQGALYNYSSSEKDLSNSRDYAEFFEHYTFVVRELFRLTMPGRISAVHCMDVPSGNTGNDHLIDFPGDIIRLHEREGWRYAGRYCIWKEPLGVRNRTMAKNLAHKSIVDDSSRCTNAAADYLLIFRRKGENPIPIAHPTGLMSYIGEREMPSEFLKYRGHKGNQIENRYSHWIWRQYASAFWDDIRIGRVVPFKQARDEEDEKHPHPLQLDVIERCVIMWSNPKENVFSPFMGVGSEICGAIMNGRRGLGVELKPSYYRQALANVHEVSKNGWIESSDQILLLEDEEDFEDAAV